MILGVNDAMLSWVCRVVLQNSVALIMCHTVTSSVLGHILHSPQTLVSVLHVI